MNEPVAASYTDILGTLSVLAWLRAVTYLAVGYFAGKYASTLMIKLFSGHLTLHQQAIVKRLVFYTLFILFAVSALRELGFQLGVLLGAAGIISVAVGFASQTSASNLISGLFLLGERPFQIGDTILVDGMRGEVISIDLLSVKLRTFDNLFVRIPNETIIKTPLTNISRFPIRRLDLKLGIAYKEDIATVRDILMKLADQNPLCLDNPKPFCVVTDFAASSVDLQFSMWCRKEIYLNFKDEMMEKVKEAFDEKHIEIPFPHSSVYSGSESEPFKIKIISGDTDDSL